MPRTPAGTSRILGVKGKGAVELTSDAAEQWTWKMQTLHHARAFRESMLSHRVEDEIGIIRLPHTCTTGAQHRTLEERPILSGYRWQF